MNEFLINVFFHSETLYLMMADIFLILQSTKLLRLISSFSF